MKKSAVSKYKVTPVNLRSGATAPSFIIETSGKGEEVSKLANAEFTQRSALSRYETWSTNVDKL